MGDAPVSSAPPADESASEPVSARAGGTGRRPIPLWARVVPYFFSAILFLSGFFSIFSPTPILTQFFRVGRRAGWLAALTNLLLVIALGGPSSGAFYFALVTVLSLTLAEMLSRSRSLEKSALAAFVGVVLSGVVGLGVYAKIHHWSNPWAQVRQEVSSSVDQWIQLFESKESAEKAPLPPETAEQLESIKESLTLELPSVVGILILMMIWANLLLLIRMSPEVRRLLSLDPLYFQKWKTPEWLVWPTIAAGFFLIVEVPGVSPVALNVFRFLMALYALQGLSVLSALFNAWRVRGALRTLGFLFVIFAAMPLLLGLGFFDLWFDFRAKVRQS